MNVWPEMPIRDPVLQFTALVTIALVVKLVFERLHLPGLIGLLVIGLLIGPGGFGVLPRGPVVDLLGHIGLVYLMFVAGLEINLEIVQEHRKETVTFGLLAFGCSLAPAIGTGLLLGYPLEAAVLLGTLLASHTLIAYPIIERQGLLDRKSVVTAIGGTLLTDTQALLLLAVMMQTVGGAESGHGTGGHWLVPLLLLAVLTAVSLWGVPRLSRFVFSHHRVTRAEKALFVLVILLLLSAAADLIGTEAILGAFLAGICLNRFLEERKELREHVEFTGRTLFIPFFFISTGMLLRIDVLTGSPSVWLLAGILLGLVLFGKMTATWLTGAIYGYPSRERVVMIGLTVPQAAATLAVTITAHEAGLFEEQVVDAVILLIFFTCLFGPLLTRYAARGLTEG